MPKLAKKVTIDHAANRVLIDGEEFPYFLADGGPRVDNPLSNDELPIVYLPVLADDLAIIPES